MIGLLFDIVKTPLKMLIMAIGIMALYAYFSGEDMNVVVSNFIEMIKPVKDALLNALKTLIPILFNQLVEFFNGI